MKMTRNKIILAISIITSLLWYGCDPDELDKPDLGTLLTSDLLDFTVNQGNDAFHYTITNTTQATALAKWDFGNGSNGSGDEVTAYYPLPGTYTITMTLYTKAGAVKKTQEIVTTETDITIFNTTEVINLSGGVDALNGKTWVMDSLAVGHLGVGPAGSNGTSWWAANPLDKKGMNLYDDEITFNLNNNFACTYVNNGKSYVKDFRANDPNYTNVVNPGADRIVDFTPAPGTWFLAKEGSKWYLTLTSAKPLFPCFDFGAADNKYEVLTLTSTNLELVGTGSDNNAWHLSLIKKGYVKPLITVDLDVVATSNTNEYQLSLKNVVIPTGMSIKNLLWKMGDGTEFAETDYTKVITHTFMRKAPYNVSVQITTSADPIVKSTVINVTQNHPSYVPYLLDMMVMYQDFGDVSLVPMAFDNSDGSGSIITIANPDASRYPNRSAKVGKYTKVNAQWANTNLKLPAGYRYNLTKQTVFKLMVYGKAGDKVLLKLENTDRGGDAWKTGAESTYTILQDNTWEVAIYNFSGVGAGNSSSGDIYTTDITTDPRFNDGFYDIIRIMYNPGDNSKEYSFYLDDLAGPHIEGL
jgi:hypothetical protein